MRALRYLFSVLWFSRLLRKTPARGGGESVSRLARKNVRVQKT